MKYFTIKINSKSDRKYLRESLESLIFKGDEKFFIFPICLFQKSYYKESIERIKEPYSGIVNETNFKYLKTIYYGNVSSGMVGLLLTIKGEIIEKEEFYQIKMDFHLRLIDYIITLLLIIGFTVAYIIYGNVLFLAIPLIYFIEIFRITFFNYFKIKRRILRKKL